MDTELDIYVYAMIKSHKLTNPASIAQWGERRVTAPTGGGSPVSSRSARSLFAPGRDGLRSPVSGSGRITGQLKSVSGAGRVRL